MLERYSITPDRSPLMSKSTNINAASPVVVAAHFSKRPRSQVVLDSFSTARGSLDSDKLLGIPGSRAPSRAPRTSSRPISSARRRVERAEIPSGKKPATAIEIPDSDDELDDGTIATTPVNATSEEDGAEVPSTPTPLPRPPIPIRCRCSERARQHQDLCARASRREK